NNQPAPDDDGNTSSNVLDFPNVLATSWSAHADPFNVIIGDSCRLVSVPNTIPVETGFHETGSIAFFKFVVGTVDAPCMSVSSSPTPALGGSTVPLRASVMPADGANNAITSVVADLSAFGGSSATPMFNNGSSGGDTAVDNVWSAQVTLDYSPGDRSWS